MNARQYAELQLMASSGYETKDLASNFENDLHRRGLYNSYGTNRTTTSTPVNTQSKATMFAACDTLEGFAYREQPKQTLAEKDAEFYRKEAEKRQREQEGYDVIRSVTGWR